MGEFRLVLGRTHIGPHHAATLETRIRFGFDARLKVVIARLARKVDAVTFDVELPAVIDAAQPGLLIASQEQRRRAVRALLTEETDAALAVAEHDQPFAHELDPYRR